MHKLLPVFGQNEFQEIGIWDQDKKGAMCYLEREKQGRWSTQIISDAGILVQF